MTNRHHPFHASHFSILLVISLMLGVAMCFTHQAQAQQAVAEQTIDQQTTPMLPMPGKDGQRYRILVDKVYNREFEGAFRSDAYYEHIAKLGFNVISPRSQLAGRYITDIVTYPDGLEDNRDDIRNQAALAQKHGLYYMGWLRGSSKPHGEHKYTSASGWEFNLCSPNSDKLWNAFEATVMDYVELSLEVPVIGILLDFEIYARPLPPTWPGHLYAISYDEKIIREFADAYALEYNPLPPDKRADWLEDKKLTQAFVDFQKKSWRQRMRHLRQRVDAVNPAFKFGIYPSYYTLFVQEAVWNELGTAQAPLLVLEHYTYVRGFPNKDHIKDYWRISDEQGAQLNVDFLNGRDKMYRNLGCHYELLGGIDPVSPGGQDPQFNAMSMLAMAEATAGYWIFYEGVAPQSKQLEMFNAWFTIANEMIAEKNFDMETLLTPANHK